MKPRFASVLPSGVLPFLFLVATLAVPAAADEPTVFELRELARTKSAAAIEAWSVDIDLRPLEVQMPAIYVDLFDGERHRIDLESVEMRGAGDFAWRGRFEDGGQVSLTVYAGHLVGVLFAPDGVYEITTSAEGQIFQKLDPASFDPCYHEDHGAAETGFHGTEWTGVDHAGEGSDLEAEPASRGNSRGATKAVATVDIMTLYTPQARTAAGGHTAIQATAQAAIDVSNTAFVNSQTNARFQLVHTGEIAYNDSGNIETDRNWMQTNSTVASLRNTHGADLVGMLVENGGGYCGIAFLMGNESASAFSTKGFQVTARSCAVGNLSYPHEHGHNMGLQHNPQNGAPSSQAYRSYAYGHYHNGNYRTVMSYSDPCPSGCTRQPYFSNPDVVFSGAATGTSSRDNARVIDEVSPFTINYRSGKACNTAPANMRAWYSLDTLSSNLADNLLTGPDGVATNGPVLVQGQVKKGWEFDGTNDYIKVNDSSYLDFGTSDLSIAAWIWTTDSDAMIVAKREAIGGNYLGYLFMVQGGRLLLQLADATNGWYNYTSSGMPRVDNGAWRHVVVTVDRNSTTGGRFYIDGDLVYTFNPSNRQASLDNASELNIGRTTGGGNYFRGTIDEVQLYNRALTATEAGNLHASLTGGQCKPVAVSLSCYGNYSGSSQVSCNALVTGGKSPYSYAWNYYGSASTWSGGGTYAYAYYSSYPYCTSSSFNLFNVSVTDAVGQTAFASVSPLSCY